MKNFILPLLASSLMLLISCLGKPGQTAQHQPESEDLNAMFAAFTDRQSRNNTVRYHVQRIDTLVNGDIWQSTGNATMKYDADNRLVFYVEREDDTNHYYFNENKYYQLLPGIKLAMLKSISGKVSGSAAGKQMVVEDLLMTDTSGMDYTLMNSGPDLFTVQIEKKEGPLAGLRQITVDKRSLVPKLVHVNYSNIKQDTKYTTTFIISEFLVNDEIQNNPLSVPDLLSGYHSAYSVMVSEADGLIGKKAPEITLNTFDNSSVNISSVKPRVLLLDFWELWCSPCKKSLPTVDKIAVDYKPFRLSVMGVVSEDIGDAVKYINEKNIRFTQGIGNTEIKTALKVSSFPRYVLIGRDGIIRGIYCGYSDGIILDVNRLLTQ